MIWIICNRGSGWRYVKPASPCNKGEIVFSVLGRQVTIGWQAKERLRQKRGALQSEGSDKG